MTCIFMYKMWCQLRQEGYSRKTFEIIQSSNIERQFRSESTNSTSLQAQNFRNTYIVKMRFVTIFMTALMALGSSAQFCRDVGSEPAPSPLTHMPSILFSLPKVL